MILSCGLGHGRRGSIARISEGSTVLSDAAEQARSGCARQPRGRSRVGGNRGSRREGFASLRGRSLPSSSSRPSSRASGRYLDQPILIIGAMVVESGVLPHRGDLRGAWRGARPRLIGPACPSPVRWIRAGRSGSRFVLWFGRLFRRPGRLRPATTGDADRLHREARHGRSWWRCSRASPESSTHDVEVLRAGRRLHLDHDSSRGRRPSALTLAVATWDEALASVVQLGVNLLGLFVAGV